MTPSDHVDASAPVSAAAVADERAACNEAVRAALAAGKVGPTSSVDAVRFVVDSHYPAWMVRGAWELALAALPPPARASEWDGAGLDPDAPADAPDILPTLDASDDEPPVIRIRAGQLPERVHATIAALTEGDRNLFQRDGQLVTIVRAPERTEDVSCPGRTMAEACTSCGSTRGVPCMRDRRQGRDIVLRPGTPRVRAINPPTLLLRTATHVAWETFDRRKGRGKAGEREGEWSPTDPCTKTVAIVHGLGDWPGIRPLKGILETPALAPSLRVIETPGYDDETGYILLPSCQIAPIKARPTRAHAEAALRYLWIEIACDFPFRGLGEPSASDPDRVLQFMRALDCPDAFVAIAMLLTIFARPAIAGAVPGGLFEAAGQGSGKSLQMHTVSLVATSRPAGVATFPVRDGKPDEIELEKILAGYALNASRIIAFDNVKGQLTGANLEKAMTAVDTIEIRVLGSNDQRTLPWPATLMFSGNNMTMSDDVAQRLLVSRLVSRREDPRARPASTFRHGDLLGAIRDRRAQLVRAVLTILRAYVCAREDGADVPDTGTLGSFEAWSRMVPPALAWAGGPNILRARPEMGRGGDEESIAHAALMRGWLSGWQGQRAAVVIQHAFGAERDQQRGDAPTDGLDEVRAAIRVLTHTPERATPSAHAFGIRLERLRDKVREGLRFVRDVDASAKVNTWSVLGLDA